MSRILEYISTGCLAALQAVACTLVDDLQDGCVALKQLVLCEGCCLEAPTCCVGGLAHTVACVLGAGDAHNLCVPHLEAGVCSDGQPRHTPGAKDEVTPEAHLQVKVLNGLLLQVYVPDVVAGIAGAT